MLEKNHGHIVSIASSAGLVGVNGLADYCASKFGAVGECSVPLFHPLYCPPVPPFILLPCSTLYTVPLFHPFLCQLFHPLYCQLVPSLILPACYTPYTVSILHPLYIM